MSKTEYLRLSTIALVIGLTVLVAVPGPARAQLSLLGGGTTSSTRTSATAVAGTVLGAAAEVPPPGEPFRAARPPGGEAGGRGGGIGGGAVGPAPAVRAR